MESLKTWKPNTTIRQLQNKKKWNKNYKRSPVLTGLSSETSVLACSFRRP